MYICLQVECKRNQTRIQRIHGKTEQTKSVPNQKPNQVELSTGVQIDRIKQTTFRMQRLNEL